MSVIDAVYEWLGEYVKNINVNYLAPVSAAVSIEANPGNHVVRKYIDGGELRQLPFTVALRDDYGSNVEANLEAPRFFEDLEKWIEKKNRAGKLPEADGIKAVSLTCTSHGYGVSNTTSTARYQMNCRFLYTVK
ncbi:MAG: hypothetical protein IJ435_03755 [Clostridia bacterium]|nr:hypothetical protein [Clostridia bacterium]